MSGKRALKATQASRKNKLREPTGSKRKKTKLNSNDSVSGDGDSDYSDTSVSTRPAGINDTKYKKTSPSKKRSQKFIASKVAPATAVRSVWNQYLNDARTNFPKDASSLPLSIIYDTMREQAIPSNWNSQSAAATAAKGAERLGRLVGHVVLTFRGISIDIMSRLIEENGAVDNHLYTNEFFDVEGEFYSPRGYIPVSRLLDGVDNAEFEVSAPHEKELLNNLFALQCPSSSGWGKPFVRLYSDHHYTDSTGILVVKIHVYFLRLLFELISDPAIMNVVANLRDPPQVIHKTTSKRQAPVQMLSDKEELLSDPDFRFSLSGVIKQAENLGYPMAERQPAALTVKLYPFQLSTYQWMLDQEQSKGGLNGQLWEHWEFSDGGPDMYYFPIGGEFRFEKPPIAYGGLLCEEMGLGKTVEVLALILGNPTDGLDEEIPTTLLVVPPHLGHQWWSEIHSRTSCGSGDGNICAINMIGCKSKLDSRSTVWYSANNIRRIKDMLDRLQPEWGDIFGDNSIQSTWFDVEVRNLDWVTPGTIVRCSARVDIHPSMRNICQNRAGVEVQLQFDIPAMIPMFDICLTTYALIKLPFYRLLKWHRIVLDECQEIKVATNTIAVTCATLQSKRRWMVSGTPLCSDLADLQGELNFLGIWPFCLSNKKDGFWPHKIGIPFSNQSEECLPLLNALIDIVMMRHSKSQRYLDGSSLVEMPNRIIEWKPVPINHREYIIYLYLEAFAAEALDEFLMRESLHVLPQSAWSRAPHYHHIRGLVGVISRCLTHPTAVNIRSLDHVRRMLLPSAFVNLAESSEDILKVAKIPLLSPEDILNQVQGIGAGAIGGLNYESRRLQASVVAAEEQEKKRKELSALTVDELLSRINEKNLPIPRMWSCLPFRFSGTTNSDKILVHSDAINDHSDGSVKQRNKSARTSLSTLAFPSVSDIIQQNSVIRIDKPSATEKTLIVIQVADNPPELQANFQTDDSASYCIGSVTVTTPWEHNSFSQSKVYLEKRCLRKEPYIELLTANEPTEASNSVIANIGVHEQGFSTIYKLIAGQAVDCPLCLMPANRPTVTMCVHVYCYECISDVLRRESSHAAKCPVCRRQITSGMIMEAKVNNFEESDVNNEEKVELSAIDGSVSSVYHNSSVISSTSGDAFISSTTAQSRSNVRQRANLPSKAKIPAGSKECESSGKSTESIHRSGNEDSTRTEFKVPENFSVSTIVPSSIQVRDALYTRYPTSRARDPSLPSIIPPALEIFRMKDISYKISAVLNDMRTTLRADQDAKFVIFSQYKESLEVTQKFIESAGFKGSIAFGSDRESQDSIAQFQSQTDCTVLYLTLGGNATGLTLTVANVCYMLEPCHNAADEAQAISRIHRIGQQKPVRCVIFYAENTMESRILNIRKNTRTLTELLGSVQTSGPKNGSQFLAAHRAQNIANKFFLGSRLQNIFGINTDDDSSDEM